MNQLPNQYQEIVELNEAQIARMFDRYTPEAQAQHQAHQAAAEQQSGVDPQRVNLWRLGVVTLSGVEGELIRTAQAQQLQ